MTTESYAPEERLKPYLEASYERLSRALSRLGWALSTPSGDGYIRRIERGERALVFTWDAPPLNHAAAHLLAQDKLGTYQVLSRSNIAVPRGIAFFAPTLHKWDICAEPETLFEALHQRLTSAFPDLVTGTAPIVVKPGRGSRGNGVHVCRTVTEALQAARTTLEYGHYGLAQEFIPGAEYRVVLLDREVLVVYRKRLSSGETEEALCNLSQGAFPELVGEPSKVLLEVAQAAADALGLRYCGIDLRCPPGSAMPVIIEANGNPAFDYFSQHHPDLGDRITSRIAEAIIETLER